MQYKSAEPETIHKVKSFPIWTVSTSQLSLLSLSDNKMLNANKSIKGGEGGLGTFAHKGAFVSTDAYNSSLK